MSNITKICENCDKEFEIEYRLRKQKFCCKKCSNEKSKIKKKYNLICEKCGNTYLIETTEYLFVKGKYKKNCSLKCANSRILSDELKSKISKSCKKSEKVKIANSIQTYGRINRTKKVKIENNTFTYKKKNKIEFTCLYCGEKGFDNRNNKNRKYHNICWKKSSGGIRKGSSRGKNGWYKGYWCDSSYELAFIIYNIENNINIERNKKGYKYYYKEKNHLYYPDFIVDGKLVEIKNFRSELTDIKLKSVNEEIKIYYKDTIKPYINYVIDKYGNNFIELYDK